MDNLGNRKFFTGRRRRFGNFALGLAFLVVGSLLMMREVGVDMPSWLFRWEMILVVVGIGIGFKSKFRDFGWIAVTGVGLFFLGDDMFPDWDASRFIFPAIILAVGLFIILNKISSGARQNKLNQDSNDTSTTDFSSNQEHIVQPTIIPVNENTAGAGSMEEEQLDVVSVFSVVNKKVFSKNFVGGEIVCVFGGSEINLMNADISAGTVELEVVCIFGGATLFIPPNWYVKSEMGSVFGGADDKRRSAMPDQNKVLIVKGVCIFGGLEIKSKFQ